MGVFDRIILTVYTFSLTFISVVIIAMSLGYGAPIDYLQTNLQRANGRWVIGLLGAAFFFVSIRLLYYAFRRRHPSQTVIHDTAMGEIRVSLDAVGNLLRRIGQQSVGVREVKPRVFNDEGGIAVELNLWVSPDVSVPEISDEIQNKVKKYVREVVGVDVTEISIFVEDISASGRRGALR